MTPHGAARATLETLDVRLGDTLVGSLVHLGNESLIFTFERRYVDAGDRRPTLSLGFIESSS
jgi:hypothetical protein